LVGQGLLRVEQGVDGRHARSGESFVVFRVTLFQAVLVMINSAVVTLIPTVSRGA
jgi:hypothetical protein